jgi:hypothetical protein
MTIMVIIVVVIINFIIRKIFLFYTVVAYSTRQIWLRIIQRLLAPGFLFHTSSILSSFPSTLLHLFQVKGSSSPASICTFIFFRVLPLIAFPFCLHVSPSVTSLSNLGMAGDSSNFHPYSNSGRSQWPRGLRHEQSSLARTLGSWARILLDAWMSVCVYLCLCCSVCR